MQSRDDTAEAPRHVHPAPRAARALLRLVSKRRHWLGAAAAATVIALVPFARADLSRAGLSLLGADWPWLAAAVALLLLALLLRSLALKVIVDAFGAGRTRVGDVFSATSIGLLAGALIPVRVGTVVTPYTLYVLQRRRGAPLPFATTLGMALTERLFAIASFVALSLLFVSTLAAPAWAVELLVACAVFAATFIVGGAVLERRRRLLDDDREGPVAREPRESRDDGAGRWSGLRRQWPALVDSQRIMGRPWSVALVAAIQTAAWLAQLVAARAALQAFHLGGAGLRGAGLVLVLTNLIGLVPMTPGNLGTFQAAVVAALATASVPTGAAVAFGLGLQAVQLLVGVAAGFASLSLQDLSLADLRTRSRTAASRLRRDDLPGPARVQT